MSKVVKHFAFVVVLLLGGAEYVYGQSLKENIYYNLGVGASILGFGDVTTFNIQNEVDLYLNQYFSTSISVISGRGLAIKTTPTLNILQGNLNLLVSPFKNDRIWNFRLGPGITYHRSNAVRLERQVFEDGILVQTDYRVDRKKGWGYSIIIDNTFRLSSKYFAGARVYTRPYFNGEINTGFLFRIGIKL